MTRQVNVIKLQNRRMYIAGLGVVQTPKRLYWLNSKRFTGWVIDPVDNNREYFTVHSNADVGKMYKAAVRQLSLMDAYPLRNERMIAVRERMDKMYPTGMAGVCFNYVNHYNDKGHVVRQYTYIRALGAGLLDNRQWVVDKDADLPAAIEKAMEYRRGVVDLWSLGHEMTEKECWTPIEDAEVEPAVKAKTVDHIAQHHFLISPMRETTMFEDLRAIDTQH